jgi:hypothetical protein
LSGGHRVIDITNGHFIHTNPLLKRDRVVGHLGLTLLRDAGVKS